MTNATQKYTPPGIALPASDRLSAMGFNPSKVDYLNAPSGLPRRIISWQ